MHKILTQSNSAPLELYGKKRINSSPLKACLIIVCLLSFQLMGHLNTVSNDQMKEVILRKK